MRDRSCVLSSSLNELGKNTHRLLLDHLKGWVSACLRVRKMVGWRADALGQAGRSRRTAQRCTVGGGGRRRFDVLWLSDVPKRTLPLGSSRTVDRGATLCKRDLIAEMVGRMACQWLVKGYR